MSESTITITKLRNHFDAYLQRVKLGGVIFITKDGKPFAYFTPAKLLQEKENIPPKPERHKKTSPS